MQGTIVFNNIPPVTINSPYYWSDIKIGVQYNILNSYEKMFDGSSKHFFLIQEAANATAPLIEVPMDNNFTYTNYNKSQALNS